MKYTGTRFLAGLLIDVVFSLLKAEDTEGLTASEPSSCYMSRTLALAPVLSRVFVPLFLERRFYINPEFAARCRSRHTKFGICP